jgi:hypothetical protein
MVVLLWWAERASSLIALQNRSGARASRQPAATLSVPVNLIWGSEPARSARAVPQWVHDFEAQREREHALDPDYQAYRKAMSKTRTGWIAMALIGCLSIALGAALWVVRRRRLRESVEGD